MKLTTRCTTLLVATLTLMGCNSEFDDVSETSEHRQVVGELCKLQSRVNAFGVTLNIEKNKRTDLIVLTTLNLSGPEITFTTRLPVTSILEVVAVRKCKNCPFENRVEYQVRLQPMPADFGSIPIYMDLKRIETGAILCKTLQGKWRAA